MFIKGIAQAKKSLNQYKLQRQQLEFLFSMSAQVLFQGMVTHAISRSDSNLAINQLQNQCLPYYLVRNHNED